MEHKKRTGVKFCGGCHISYDRSDALQKIMSASTCIYENVKDDTEYDNLLVYAAARPDARNFVNIRLSTTRLYWTLTRKKQK